jgi:hypothetical protein
MAESLGTDEFDRLAFDLVRSDPEFDAVERDGYRARWTDDDARVVVEAPDTGRTVAYSGEDLVIAASDQEVENARVTEAPG